MLGSSPLQRWTKYDLNWKILEKNSAVAALQLIVAEYCDWVISMTLSDNKKKTANIS